MNRLHPSQRERFWAPRGRVTGWICLGVGGLGGALVAMVLTGLGGFVGLGGAGGLGGRGGLGTGCFLGCRRRTSGCSWWLRARAVYELFMCGSQVGSSKQSLVGAPSSCV